MISKYLDEIESVDTETKISYTMRIKCIILLLTVLYPLFSQNSSSDQVDSLLEVSYQKFAELKFIESSEIADEALNLSILDNYSKGIVMSNIYIAKVLLEIGLNMEALEYLEEINEEPFFMKETVPKVEYNRLKGRVYGNQQLYTLAKNEFNKQLMESENLSDPKKRELSKLWAYQNIEHLYALQELTDSVEVYHVLQDKQLSKFDEYEVHYNIASLKASRGRLFINRAEYDSARVELQKSIDMLDKYNVPYKYYSLELMGDLQGAKGNVHSAISYYDEALDNSMSLNANPTSRDLHKKISDYLLNNDTLIDKAREHRHEYTLLNDSLEGHNKMIVSRVLDNIINDKDKASDQKAKLYIYTVTGAIVLLILLGIYLFIKIKTNKRRLSIKSKELSTRTEKIESLEEELESNIYQEIIELAKSNSPEFLPLFGKGYPEFVAAMKELDPTIRSSELYFCALAYLNFSTKDIASFTFVTNRAVQVRRNRMRKKYDISSEADFNEWFRNLVNGDISSDKDIGG